MITIAIMSSFIFQLTDAWRQSSRFETYNRTIDGVQHGSQLCQRKRLAYVWKRTVMPMAVSTGIMIIIGICINFVDVMPVKVIGTRTAVTAAVSFLTVVMLLPPTFIFYENDVRKQCQNV